MSSRGDWMLFPFIVGTLPLGGAVLAAMLIPPWHRQGLILPARIAESSMAPALCGDHWLVSCPYCRTQFAVDAQLQRRDRQIACVKCGRSLSAATHAEFRRGQRVLIQQSSRSDRGPQRWDVWALHPPGRGDRLQVKRVVGLPGERVALRDGDVYVDGRILRKSLAELRQLAILVTEDQFEPDVPVKASGGSRWQLESKPSGWRQTAEGLEFIDSLHDQSDSLCDDWLHYAHGGTSAGALICDDYAYNSTLSRRLNPVSDLLLQCDLSVSPVAALAFRAQSKGATWVLTWRVGPRHLELRKDGELLAQHTHDMGPTSGVCRAEFGLCDRQILFGLDGRQCMRFPYSERAAGTASRGDSTRVALGAGAGRLVIHQLRVLRDIYYERPRGPRAWPLPTALAADQFFLLGDNSPRSVDSRHRILGPVARQRLIGAVRPLAEGGDHGRGGSPTNPYEQAGVQDPWNHCKPLGDPPQRGQNVGT